MNKYVQVAKKLLGEDIFEELKKSEIGSGIFKQSTKTALDPEELKIALQIVPRAILSFLVANLKPLEEGGNVELHLPFANATMYVTKFTHDVYMGEIIENGKVKAEFKYRSLPGIGLILMSTFELYDIPQSSQVEAQHENKINKLQEIIDDRLKLHSLIRDVVDQRISEREAIQRMIADRLPQQFSYEEDSDDIEESEDEEELSIDISDEEDEEEPKEDIMDNLSKKSKLKEFLENREKKRQEKVELDKSEHISCPDCKTNLYKGEDFFKLCLCYGSHYNKDIKIKKTEDGKYKFKFPKSFDLDNVEMLLDAIKENKKSNKIK